MTIRQTTEQPIRSPGIARPREQLLAGLPVTHRQLQLAGVSTAVLEGGDGPPVVLNPVQMSPATLKRLPSVKVLLSFAPPQTIISVPVQTAV